MCGRHCRVASRWPRAGGQCGVTNRLAYPSLCAVVTSSLTRIRRRRAQCPDKRSVRPLPLKEESGPFFLACAIVARVSVCAHYVCHTPSGESPAFAVIFSAFPTKAPCFLLLPARFLPASLLRADTPSADGGKGEPIAAATCAERAARRPVWRVRSEGGDKCRPCVGLLQIDHGGVSGGCRRPACGGGAG